MPVASSIVAAGIGAAGAVASSALAPKGKKAAAISAQGQAAGSFGDRFRNIEGMMSPSSGMSMIDRVNQATDTKDTTDSDKYMEWVKRLPESPATKFAEKVDEIFKPQITKVGR